MRNFALAFELKLDRSIHNAVIPWRYLKGVSGGDMCEVLKVLLGLNVTGISPVVVSRLKRQWEQAC